MAANSDLWLDILLSMDFSKPIEQFVKAHYLKWFDHVNPGRLVDRTRIKEIPMTSNPTRIAALIIFLTIYGAAPVGRVMSQQTSASKDQPLRVVQYDGDMAHLLANLTDTFGVTIGFEVDPKQPQPRVSFYVRDATLSDVLNAIVKSAPAYDWRERDGSIEVLPVRASSPLLDTRIDNFQVSEVDQIEAVNRLLKLPEVQANLRAMGLNQKETGSVSTETKVEKFSINLDGVTMRQALSRIANESGGRFWIFRPLGGGFFSISNSPR
jgi:hypothetical protein